MKPIFEAPQTDCNLLDDYRWLLGSEGQRWLAEVQQRPAAPLEQLPLLRRFLAAERAGLVCETVELRTRARLKFPQAERMYFTRRALQQATDAAVASYKARQVPPDLARWDLCCGIGGDAVALGAGGSLSAVDQDPRMTLLTEANAQALDVPGISLFTTAVEARTYPTDAFLHVDPDRRVDGRRRARDVEQYQPPLSELRLLLKHAVAAAVKLAPAAELSSDWDDGQREWISRKGECRQQIVWLGSLATQPGWRRATAVGEDGQVLGQFAARLGQERVPLRENVGDYLYEPDPAVLAADLTDALANRYELARVAPRIAYLTADHHVPHPLLTCFRVREVLPFDRRQLKATLRVRGIGRLEIKKRGIELDPADLERRLRGTGPHQATLIVTPTPSRVVAVIAERQSAERGTADGACEF